MGCNFVRGMPEVGQCMQLITMAYCFMVGLSMSTFCLSLAYPQRCPSYDPECMCPPLSASQASRCVVTSKPNAVLVTVVCLGEQLRGYRLHQWPRRWIPCALGASAAAISPNRDVARGRVYQALRQSSHSPSASPSYSPNECRPFFLRPNSMFHV